MVRCPKCNAENSEWALNCVSCQYRLREVVSQSSESAQKVPQDKTAQKREPVLAAALSAIYMGLGQAYNGHRVKGYLLFFSPFLVTGLFIALKIFSGELKSFKEEPPVMLYLGFLPVWIFGILDAYMSAGRINKKGIITGNSPGRSVFLFLRNIVLIAVILIGSIFLFFASLPGLKGCFPSQHRVSSKSKPRANVNAKANNISDLLSYVDLLSKVTGTAQTSSENESPHRVIKPGTYRVDGVVYALDNSFVMLNGELYHINDQVDKVKIINITSEKVTIKFPDGKEKEYWTGDIISNE
jgi:hypothetical protein